MGSLLVVTGPPGAGKSTVSSLLVRRFEHSVLVEGDRFFAFLAAGRIEPWLADAHAQNEAVTEAAAVATGRFAKDYETVYDGVIGPWFLEQFARATALTSLDYVIVLPSLEVCLERVRTRTGHRFTDEAATRRMYDEFAEAEIDDRHVIRTDPADAESTVDEIEQARHAGHLHYVIGG